MLVPTKRFFLGFGNYQVSVNTVGHMIDAIKQGSEQQYVRDKAEKITENVPDRDKYKETKAIFDWLRASTRYVNDIKKLEYFKTPLYTLQLITGGRRPGLDCDDYTVTGLALLRSLGFRTGIRITGYGPDKEFTHVYGMVNVEGKWLPFDCVRKEITFPWEAPSPTVRKDFEVG